MNVDPLNITGHTIGEYGISSFLDGGAFGLIYEAQHIPSGAAVAIKILKPNAGLPQHREFDNERQLLLKMTGSRGVVDILDAGDVTVNVVVAGGSARFPVKLRYHVLELADGCLAELLTDLPALDWTSRLALFRGVVLGVHQMHNRGLVHRDLKSSNCLLFAQKDGLVAKVSDLGRSRDLTQAAGALPPDYVMGRGDPDFAPPEFLCGLGDDTPQTHRCADLYGLGSVFYELAVGQGITGLAVFPQAERVMAYHSLSPDERRAAYTSRLAETRDWYQPAFELFEAATPAAIRHQAGWLIRQLCDPDPSRRLPQVAPGKRMQRPNGLCWILNRIDILRLTFSNAIKQTQRLQSRKGVLR